MAKWEDKTVRRDHRVEYLHSEKVEIEGVGDAQVHFFTETYIGRAVDSWAENDRGKIVQECTKGICDRYRVATSFSKISPKTPYSDWICQPCAYQGNARKRRIVSKNEYSAAFPKRIMAFSRALRKLHPEFNSRKSRISNDIVLNGYYYRRNDDMRKKVNLLGYEYHLHIGAFKDQDANDGQDRLRISMQDISPMLDEHFRDHGHKGGIRKENR